MGGDVWRIVVMSSCLHFVQWLERMPGVMGRQFAVSRRIYVLIFIAIVCSIEAEARSYLGTEEVNRSSKLYPYHFSVFGAYEGQQFTIGHVVMIIAKFPDHKGGLPQPEELGPTCIPTMLLNLRQSGNTCYNITAAPSTKRLESVYGFSFADDPDLQTDTSTYNHWVFPLYVLDGMATSRLQVKGLIIPPSCNSPSSAFENENLISHARRLKPTVLVDTVSPAILSIHTGKSPGVYSVGSVITISVEFSKDVVLSALPEPFSPVYVASNRTRHIPYGVPYLLLNSGAIAPLRGYDGPRSRAALAFIYEVGMGEETPPGEQLDVVPGSAIELNGGAILAEGTGLDINMTSMPVPGGEGGQASSPPLESLPRKPRLCKFGPPAARKPARAPAGG